MRYYFIFIMFILCVAAPFSTIHAKENIFGDYYKDIQKPAEANATNVYNAWGENMANMIEGGYRDGVVIKGEGEYAGGRVKADGVGNVVVDKNANVGPIINKTQIKDSTVIIKKDSNRNKW